MTIRYIIQKREIKERHGSRPHLMGPYRTCYSDIKPPFDLTDKGKIEYHLLSRFGEGRYQVKSVGKPEGEDKSKITVHFSGDVERYKPRSRVWTKEERVASLRLKWRAPKEKLFVLVAFLIAFIIAIWLFLYTLSQGLAPDLVVLAVIAIFVVFIGGAFFIDMMNFEGE